MYRNTLAQTNVKSNTYNPLAITIAITIAIANTIAITITIHTLSVTGYGSYAHLRPLAFSIASAIVLYFSDNNLHSEYNILKVGKFVIQQGVALLS